MELRYMKILTPGITAVFKYEIDDDCATFDKKAWKKVRSLHRQFKGECPAVNGEESLQNSTTYISCLVGIEVLYDQAEPKTIKKYIDLALSQSHAFTYINSLWRMATKELYGVISNLENCCIAKCDSFYAVHSVDMERKQKAIDTTVSKVSTLLYPAIYEEYFQDSLESSYYIALYHLSLASKNNTLKPGKVYLFGGMLIAKNTRMDFQDCIDELIKNGMAEQHKGIFVKEIVIYENAFYDTPISMAFEMENELGLPGFFLGDVPSMQVSNLVYTSSYVDFSMALRQVQPYATVALYRRFIIDLLSATILASSLYGYGVVDEEHGFYSIVPQASAWLIMSDLHESPLLQ